MGLRGPKSRLTARVQEQICAELKEGSHRRFAAALVGVDESTLSRWYHRGAADPDGRDEGGVYRRFHLAVCKAEAEFVQSARKTLKDKGEAKSLQWYLSRLHPDLFGRKDNVESQSFEDKAAATKALTDVLFERLGKFLPDEEPAVETPAPTPEAP